MKEEISAFMEYLRKQKEEAKLFQFLNGLIEVYAPQRSQMLMMSELPPVEKACNLIQQEESQRMVLKMKVEPENYAMYTKEAEVEKNKEIMKCEACGKTGHWKRDCWTIKGYPPGHPESQIQNKEREVGSGSRGGRGGRWGNRGGRFGRGGRRFQELVGVMKRVQHPQMDQALTHCNR